MLYYIIVLNLQIVCHSIATSLPVFVYNGAISHNDMMRVIQSIATAATKYNMVCTNNN